MRLGGVTRRLARSSHSSSEYKETQAVTSATATAAIIAVRSSHICVEWVPYFAATE
jgi:hypothetical protein